MNINKEKFCSLIDSLDKFFTWQCDVEDVFGVILETPALLDFSSDVIRFLEDVTNDEHGWIWYFCYPMNFGKEYEDGHVILDDNTDYDLSTPEALWELIKENRGYSYRWCDYD